MRDIETDDVKNTILILIASLVSVGILWLISWGVLRYTFSGLRTSSTVETSVSFISVLVNLLLTLGILYLYWNQTKLLRDQRNFDKEQTSIAERQQKIMEAEYIPIVEVSVEGVEENKVRIRCSNNGTGPAKNFEINTEFYAGSDSMNKPYLPHDTVKIEPLPNKEFREEVENKHIDEIVRNYKGNSETPRRAENEEGLANIRSEEILHPGDETVLEFSLYFERYTRPVGNIEVPDTCSFNKGVEELSDEGIETLGIKISLSYNDIFDEKVENGMLANSWININEESLRELLEKSDNRTILHVDPPRMGEEYYQAGYFPS